MLLLVSAVGFLWSCKDDEKEKPVIELDFPVVGKEAGKVIIFAKFETAPCEDVVLAGSHCATRDSLGKIELTEAGGVKDWATDNINAMGRFVSAGVIDGKDWGAEGWWKITITLPDTCKVFYSDDTKEAILGIKPVQLKGGAFPADWSSQVGYVEETDVVVKSGDVDVTPGYAKECNIYIQTNATVAMIFKRWKKNPCVPTPTHNYTFNVTVPAGTPAGAVPHIAGGMNGWSATGSPLTQVGSTNVWTISFQNLEEETEYKYVLGVGGAGTGSWNNEELKAIEGEDTCATGVSNRLTDEADVINDTVENWKDITADRC